MAALLRHPEVVALLLGVGTLLAAFVASGPRAAAVRRTRAAASVFGVWLIVVVTLYPTGASGAPGVSLCLQAVGSDLLAPVRPSDQDLLNVLLFVPAASALTVSSRRAWASLAAMVGLSTAVELLQAMLGSHTCTASDWRANCLGAALGVMLGAGVQRVLAEDSTTA